MSPPARQAFRFSARPDFGHPTGKTPISKPGTYSILFSNVDDEMRLWVDGHRIEFDNPTSYENLDNGTPTRAGPDTGTHRFRWCKDRRR